MKRFLWLGFVVFLFAICLGCGDVFRPVIIPNPPAFPDPRASHSVMAVNDNGTDRGSNLVINVSGDSVTGVADTGLAPVHAVQQTANQVLVVNHSFTGGLGDSLTKINFFPFLERWIIRWTGAIPRMDDVGWEAAMEIIEKIHILPMRELIRFRLAHEAPNI